MRFDNLKTKEQLLVALGKEGLLALSDFFPNVTRYKKATLGQLVKHYLLTGCTESLTHLSVIEEKQELNLTGLCRCLKSIKARLNWQRALEALKKTQLLRKTNKELVITEAEYYENRGIPDLKSGRTLHPHDKFIPTLIQLMRHQKFWQLIRQALFNCQFPYADLTQLDINLLSILLQSGVAIDIIMEAEELSDEDTNELKALITNACDEIAQLSLGRGDVRHLSPESQRSHTVDVDKHAGIVYTTLGKQIPEGIGMCCVVVNGKRRMMIQKERGVVNHPTPARGAPVETASIIYRFGKDYHLSVASGHYLPGFTALRYELRFFIDNNLRFTLGVTLGNDKIDLNALIPIEHEFWCGAKRFDDLSESQYIPSEIRFKKGQAEGLLQNLDVLYELWSKVHQNPAFRKLLIEHPDIEIEFTKEDTLARLLRVQVNEKFIHTIWSQAETVADIYKDRVEISFDEFVLLYLGSASLQQATKKLVAQQPAKVAVCAP